MGTFDVYVEGPADSSPDATRRLAGAMAARYGLPAAELLVRLEKGRFRVKGNLDRATADTYARDLEAIGARVVIVGAATPTPHAGTAATSRPASTSLPPATEPRASSSALPPATVARPATSSLPPATVSRPAPSSSLPPATVSKPAPGSPLPPATSSRPAPSSSLPPATTSRPAPSSSLPPATTSRPAPTSSLPPANVAKPAPVSSGLAAAFSGPSHDQPATSLGALDSVDMLSLSSLDGSDRDEPQAPASFAPPAAVATAQPIDRFSAPDVEAELVVELAPEEVAYRERRRASVQPATTSAPMPVVATAPREVKATTLASETPRWRFAAGVLLAVALGFVPAHLVAATREQAKLAQIDKAVIARQAAVETPEAYAALDGFRAEQIARKTSERRMIALLAIAIWVAAAGLVAFVWFRLIPWDRR